MQEVFEKIIEKIKSDSSVKLYGSKNSGNYMIPVDVAIEIVNQEAEQYNNGWVPYNEPPKTGEYVLLHFESFPVPIVGRYEENERGGAYYIGDDDVTCINQDIFVNAWQPLPAPYQPTRESCSNRHENGNCLAVGGFCTSVDDKYCKYHKKKTNFDICCESMEAMAQIIDIAKIGWTKEQIMEWMQKEVCEVPE